MKNDLDPIRRAPDPRLSPEERNAMRTSFHSYLDAHPASVASPVRSPYYPVMRYVSYAFMAFLAVSAPVVYAAEYSLPSDTLYPLKTLVIEPAYVGVVAWTDEAEADAYTAIVERRFEEAETLALRDELDDENAVVLLSSISNSVTKIRTHIENRTTAEDYNEALETGSDVETVLEAHERILESLVDPATEADDFVAQITAIGNDTEDYNEQVEEKQRSTSEPDEAQLAKLRAEAEDAITALTDSVSEELQDSTVDTLLSEASASFADAQKFAEEGAQDEALSRMREALEIAEQGAIVLELSSKLTDAAE